MTNDEEKELKEELPFFVEEKMEQLGAKVETESPFKPNVVVEERRLITAQNPQSAKKFAEKIYEALESSRV